MVRERIRFNSFSSLLAKTKTVKDIVHGDSASSCRIFLSADLGTSWTDITSEEESTFVRTATGIQLLANGKTSLTQDKPMFYPGYGEDAPINLRSVMNLFLLDRRPLVAVDENTYYRTGIYGTHRTTDGGFSSRLWVFS